MPISYRSNAGAKPPRSAAARAAEYRTAQTREANAYWKGDAAGKYAFHRRLYALHGKPCKCAVCGTTEAKRFDYANLTGNYHDITDYAPMSRACHSRYDRKILNIKKMRRDADAQA